MTPDRKIFAKRLQDLSEEDQELIRALIEALGGIKRPDKPYIEGLRPEELLGWPHVSLQELFQNPDDLIGPSQIYWMSPEGIAYFFPAILALGLLEPDSDLIYELFDKISFSGNGSGYHYPVDLTDCICRVLKRLAEVDPDFHIDDKDEDNYYLQVLNTFCGE